MESPDKKIALIYAAKDIVQAFALRDVNGGCKDAGLYEAAKKFIISQFEEKPAS